MNPTATERVCAEALPTIELRRLSLIEGFHLMEANR